MPFCDSSPSKLRQLAEGEGAERKRGQEELWGIPEIRGRRRARSQ